MRIKQLQIQTLSGRPQDGAFGVGEFFVSAVVAAVVDEFLGGGEVGLRGFQRVGFLAEEEAGTVEADRIRRIHLEHIR